MDRKEVSRDQHLLPSAKACYLVVSPIFLDLKTKVKYFSLPTSFTGWNYCKGDRLDCTNTLCFSLNNV